MNKQEHTIYKQKETITICTFIINQTSQYIIQIIFNLLSIIVKVMQRLILNFGGKGKTSK